MTNLTAALHQADGTQFGALVSEGAGTTGVPKFWRAANVSGDYGDARVVLYDAAGNPLLVADDAAFAVGATRVMPMGALADETAPDSVDEGDVGVPRMTLARVLRTVPSTAAGADLGPLTEADFDAKAGSPTEAAPATDTASSGLNGRLQRVAQRLTSLIGLLPTSLGQKTMANSLAVVVASDQSAVPVSNGQFAAAAALAAGTAYPTTTIARTAPMLDNGTTLDPQRANTEGTLLALAARTANTSSATLTNHNARGVILTLRVTAASGTGGLTTRIYLPDPVSGSTATSPYLNTTPTAVTATGTYHYVFYPGVAAVGVVGGVQLVNVPLPRTWKADVQHADASSYTYSLAFSYVV